MTILESCQRLAGWIWEQIERSANPLKYETPDERIERHRREDHEHELKVARLNQQPQTLYVREDRYMNDMERYQEKYPNSEFNSWNGSGDGVGLYRKRKKNR